jgi:tripartite-type tricarboxylate transporter receptor subunit TctC
MIRTRIPRRALLGAAPALALAPAARAETWPSRPIRLVVPYPPGGGSDTMARIIYPRVAERLGQPIVIDNRGGATGTIGEAAVIQAPADG